MLNSAELRSKYLKFFEKNGHTIISSASLIPENDPTVLFTTAGMHPLVPYLMGQKHPAGTRLTDAQKCIRTGDIDEVGDRWHLTFFEMLGNWSLGDYWKKDAITWSFEFLTKELNLPIKKLAVTVFEGDAHAPVDNESAEIWLSLGIPKDRIAYLGKADNWWGPAGLTGPCGPDTEMFYWTGENDAPKVYDPKNKQWVEIWNDVFMEYYKNDKGEYVKATQQNVDTGMGLERTVAALNNFHDAYQTDTMFPIIKKIAELSGKKYAESPASAEAMAGKEEITKSMRIVADHLRAAVMIIGDQRGVAPSNVDQGYVVRRLIRRAVRKGKQLGIKNYFCAEVAEVIIDIFKNIYSEMEKNKTFVLNEMKKEEEKFRKTLEEGVKIFEKSTYKHLENKVTGVLLYTLYHTYGFPLEVSLELVKEKELELAPDAIVLFNQLMESHKNLSRLGAEQKFKGGLADTSEESTKLHTATHLLHAALRKVLGSHVEQKGSNITAERLRFDFSHPEKMTAEQIKQVEDLVNAAISKDYPVSFQELTVAEAKTKGAMGLFEDKYGAKVKVYTVGDPNQTPNADMASATFSMEICGGPHVEYTGLIGKFKIKKEEASSAGIRRIKAVVEKPCTTMVHGHALL